MNVQGGSKVKHLLSTLARRRRSHIPRCACYMLLFSFILTLVVFGHLMVSDRLICALLVTMWFSMLWMTFFSLQIETSCSTYAYITILKCSCKLAHIIIALELRPDIWYFLCHERCSWAILWYVNFILKLGKECL